MSALDLDPSLLASFLVISASALAMGLFQRPTLDHSGLLKRSAAAFGISISAMIMIAVAIPWLATIDLALIAGHTVAFSGIVIQRIITSRLTALDLVKLRVLVIGSDHAVATLHALERSVQHPSFIIVGSLSEHQVASDPACVSEAFRQTQAHEIIVPAGFDPVCTQEFLECHVRGARISSLSSFVERETREIELNDPEAVRLFFLNSKGRGWSSNALKRLLDLAGSLVLLVLMAPVMTVAALAIRLTDGGPIFYRQERTGLYGRSFLIRKFRTMRVDAEADGRARWAQPNDPRITRVGAFMRKTRIDELPQLFNVLGGDMSLVGPRPERPLIVADLERSIPLYSCRHFVHPGITGWAQVNFPYGASYEDAVRKTRYDLYYVKNGSTLLDIFVLLKTIRVVLMGGVEPPAAPSLQSPSFVQISEHLGKPPASAPYEMSE